MNVIVRYIPLYLGLTFLVGLQIGCSQDDPEILLRQSLKELVNIVEQKKRLALTNKLTLDFSGNQHFTHRSMSALIFRYYLQHKIIRLYTLINVLEVKTQNTGKITFHVALTSTTSTLPESLRVFKVESKWRREDKAWKIARANWMEVRPNSVYPQIIEQVAEQKIPDPPEG